MLKEVFGNCPQVKTIDFLLATYDGHYNKTQIANGAKISRPTLNNFIDRFLKYNLLKKVDEHTFELNNDSEIVKLFGKANLLLADIEADIQSKNRTIEKIEYTEEELDEIMDELFDDEYELTEDEYQEEIAKKEQILVNKKEYFLLKNHFNHDDMNYKPIHNAIISEDKIRGVNRQTKGHINAGLFGTGYQASMFKDKKHEIVKYSSQNKNKEKNVLRLGHWDKPNFIKKIVNSV